MSKIQFQQIIQNKNTIMTFGRYKGSRVRNLPKGYLWALYHHGWIKIARKFYKEFKLLIYKPKPVYRNNFCHFGGETYDIAEDCFRSAYGY